MDFLTGRASFLTLGHIGALAIDRRCARLRPFPGHEQTRRRCRIRRDRQAVAKKAQLITSVGSGFGDYIAAFGGELSRKPQCSETGWRRLGDL